MPFCRTCGKQIMFNEAEVCTHCGVRISERKTAKSKTIAVILTVIFGFWGWLYTYKEDAVKFWVSLGLILALWIIAPIPFIVAWVASIIDVACRDGSFYDNYQ